MTKKRAIALVTALSVGTILCIFAAAFLVFVVNDHHAARMRQQAIQAQWNARAGLEHYLAEGHLPPVDASGQRRVEVVPNSDREYCLVHLEARTGNLRFEGVSGLAHRSLVLLAGNPDRVVLEPR